MSKNDSEPKCGNKAIVDIVKPYYSQGPTGDKYKQYSRFCPRLNMRNAFPFHVNMCMRDRRACICRVQS